jgi:hypothetical protein
LIYYLKSNYYESYELLTAIWFLSKRNVLALV